MYKSLRIISCIALFVSPIILNAAHRSGQSNFDSFKKLENPCISAAKDSYTCRQLGMKAKDYNSSPENTKILIRAINSGYRIKVDDIFFLDGNSGDINQSIHLYGKGCLIFKNAIKITNNIPEIDVSGVTIRSYNIYSGKPFDENVSTAFIFPVNDKKYGINSIAIRNCWIDNITLIRFQNRSGDTIHSVTIEGNKWTNMSYVGMAIGSTNIDSLKIHKNKAEKIKSRLFDFGTSTNDIIKKVSITNNNLSNKGYISTTTEFYAGFAVIECLDAFCDENIVEDFLVANPKVNLYDIYCNCRNLIYTNNKKRNVLNFQDINLLCKAKSFKGEQGSRVVEDNSFIVDDDIIEKYHTLITPDCSIKMMTLADNVTTQQAFLSIRNNHISARIPCSFGMSGCINVSEAHIQNNTIDCSSIASGDSYFSGKADVAYISNNRISSKTKVVSTTPAVKLQTGRYVLEDCSISSFPGVILPDVESSVSRCNLTFSYNEKPSPDMALGGFVSDCVIDFQGYDLANNFNIYLAKAKNALCISDLKVKNAPTQGSLWLRYLLDKQRSADYLELKIVYSKQTKVVLIDNVSRIVYVSSHKHPVRDSKQSVDLIINDSKSLQLTFYGDRLGIAGLSDDMRLSISELSDTQFISQCGK